MLWGKEATFGYPAVGVRHENAATTTSTATTTTTTTTTILQPLLLLLMLVMIYQRINGEVVRNAALVRKVAKFTASQA